MNFRNLFSKKDRTPSAAAERHPAPAARAYEELDMDSLDDCVGGRADSQDVSCYLQSVPSQAH